MPADFSLLTTEVAELTDVVNSATALMDGFQGRLDAAITADNLKDNSNVVQFRDAFAAEKTRLAEAVARNTPADTGGGTGDGGGTGEPTP